MRFPLNQKSILAPTFNGDCADLQRRYRSAGSGLYALHDWSCSKPEKCIFTAHCEMDVFGGGWTVSFRDFVGFRAH